MWVNINETATKQNNDKKASRWQVSLQQYTHAVCIIPRLNRHHQRYGIRTSMLTVVFIQMHYGFYKWSRNCMTLLQHTPSLHLHPRKFSQKPHRIFSYRSRNYKCKTRKRTTWLWTKHWTKRDIWYTAANNNHYITGFSVGTDTYI